MTYANLPELDSPVENMVEPEQRSVRDRIAASAPKLARDAEGRIVQVELVGGGVMSYVYDSNGRPTLDHSVLDGKLRNREASLRHIALKQMEKNQGWRQLSREGTGAALKTGGSNCDYTDTSDPTCGFDDDFWTSCAADLTCFGFMDNINSFVGNLANWVGAGAAAAGTFFGTLSVLAGDAAAVVLAEIGLGGALGGAIVIAFAGGYIVGTGINYVGTWVYNRSTGQLVLCTGF